MGEVIRGFYGSEYQKIDHLYLVKETYFDKQYKRKDAHNNLQNNI